MGYEDKIEKLLFLAAVVVGILAGGYYWAGKNKACVERGGVYVDWHCFAAPPKKTEGEK